MPAHDVIDNRQVKLVDQILGILPESRRARFAVGYFFLSGFEALADKLDEIEELRLLIGNTSSRETIEQLTEGFKRLELAQDRQARDRHIIRAERHQRVEKTGENLRDSIAVMDQTEQSEQLICSLIRMIEEGRLKVRVYTRGRLHAKAYIFDFTHPSPGANGIAVVGSSNLTLAGVSDNTELNVLVHDQASVGDPTSGNHGKLVDWFEQLWDESEDFEAHLMRELRQSWAADLASPRDVYLKTLYTLVRDRLDEKPGETLVGGDRITRTLANFQQRAVTQAVRMINENGGCFVADVVGLGKSYIGAAIIKHFERTERRRALIICPKSLEEMWRTYNQDYELNAEVLPMSMLIEGDRGADLLNDVHYRDRNFILIDESHNFRNTETQRYRELQSYVSADPERKVCLLTATPRNSHARDILSQIRLFHPDDQTTMPIDPPNLAQFFQRIDRAIDPTAADEAQPARLQDLLRFILIRRTRRHILRWYGRASDTGAPLSTMSDEQANVYLDGWGGNRAYIEVAGRQQYFPLRELRTLRYSIEETYDGLYDRIRGYLGRGNQTRANRISLKPDAPDEELTYARYGLYNYLHRDKRRLRKYSDLHRAGRSLRGLMRTMLFKRLESSVEAFRLTLTRMVRTQRDFLRLLDQGIVPAGEHAERLLGRGSDLDEDDVLASLRLATERYDTADFDIERLQRHIESDIRLMEEMLRLVEPITAQRDAKLQSLVAGLSSPDMARRKRLIFTQYSDTAAYLYRNLGGPDSGGTTEVIYGNDVNKSRIVARFAPKANPQVRLGRGDTEIQTLIATDVLAEGLNMQDCDVVINYDLHWNPVRLIQRFGRIDRIGSEHEHIYGYNFLPETGIDRNLGLTQVLQNRIQEIHQTIGEDAAILDQTEQINPTAMYAIYESRTGDIERYEDDANGGLVDLNEAEEYFRRLREQDPEEFERIASLPDGIRSARYGAPRGRFVCCEAGRYHRLYLVDEDGSVLTSDISRVLEAVRTQPDTSALPSLLPGHNQLVTKVMHQFRKEVERRRTQQTIQQQLTLSQRYVQETLRKFYAQLDEHEDRRDQISVLERAFTMTLTAAVKRELDYLRREQVDGEVLVDRLSEIFYQHHLHHRLVDQTKPEDSNDIPHIVCSMALVG
jgi:superfamily II DNA or RNA helicase